MSLPPEESLRSRAARLGWVTATLALLALVLAAVAIWIFVVHGSDGHQSRTVLLPVDVELNRPAAVLLIGALAAQGAVFLGLAALDTAAAMQVLSPDRRVPAPPTPGGRRVRQVLLGPPAADAIDPRSLPEWPASAVPSPAELPPGTRLRCTVLIPAHDEEAVLGATLESLRRQTRIADTVVVIADNCTDATIEIAAQHGVEVVETVGNTEKKAGALNQQLARMLPDLEPRDVVMVMDADSTIGPEFLATALDRLESDPDLVAVGGLFYGEEGSALVGQLQRNEFVRYQRVVGRKQDRVFVLTGTAALVRGYALHAVADARGRLIPGTQGQVYDTLALTEDNELTLALKSLGGRMSSPPQCRVRTEIMPDWRSLWRQRLRWHRGALENIGAYGLTRATAMYWGQQLGLAYGVIALYTYLELMLVSLLAADHVRWSWFWIAIGFVFLANRLLTAWSAGWRGRLLAAPIFLELAYAAFLQACFVVSLVQIATGRKAGWNYVPRPAMQAVAAAALVTAGPFVPLGILLPAAVLQTAWFEALAYLVGINTLVFACLAILEMLPPIRLRHPRMLPARHWR